MRKRRSSLRRTGAPSGRAAMSRALRCRCLGAGFDRLDDVVVAGATADIAFETGPDLLLARVLVDAQEIDRAHHHAGRAEAALEGVVLAERRLHRVELVALGEAFDRHHARPVHLGRQHGAALCRIAVDMDDASTALAGVAADMGAGQTEMLAQELHQQGPCLDLAGFCLAVHRDRYGGHSSLSLVIGLRFQVSCAAALWSSAPRDAPYPRVKKYSNKITAAASSVTQTAGE